MKPIDILDKLISYIPADSMRRKPGDLVSKLPKEDRKILAELKSDDSLRMRMRWSRHG